jgi:hypothetical protein
MMQRFILFAFVAAAALFAAIPAFAERPVNLPQLNTIPVLVNFGAKSIATPTVTLTPGVKTNIGAYLPTGTIDFTFDVWDGDILIGHEDNLATAAVKWTGYKIASGTQGFKWEAAGGGTINLWAMPNDSATCTIIFGVACGQWEE